VKQVLKSNVEIWPTQIQKLILNEMFAGFIKFLNTSLYRMTHINYGINSDAVNTLSPSTELPLLITVLLSRGLQEKNSFCILIL